jgi:hypothetical protein
MTIERYDFGRITIDGQTFEHDVIIHPGRVEDGWRRRDGHILEVDDLKAVWPSRPEVLVIGTGYHGRMRVPPETRDFIAERGIILHAAPTREAVTLFNRLLKQKDGRVVAALHITC